MNLTDTETLGADFWAWRSAEQPRTADDIPRIARPVGWTPRWSAEAVAGYRSDLARFEQRLAQLDPSIDRADAVDRRLLGSAFARVRWELDVLRSWQTQPRFYVDQTIGNVFDLLTPPAPDSDRIARVAEILEASAQILDEGRINLTGHAVAEFAQGTVSELRDIEQQVADTVTALAALPVANGLADRLHTAAASAGQALGRFRAWLEESVTQLQPMQPIGRDLYQWFLAEVALLPFTPEQILATGRAELDRAIVLETLERNRNQASGNSPTAGPAPTPTEQCATEAEDELQVRRFYVERGLLTQPDTMHHYRFAPLPDYLVPIGWLGVTDDLTGPDRLDQDGTSYVPSFPTGEMPYFYAANAHDPRAGIVHEGAHYQQLSLSWRHERPIRRHYYDSGANEGIAFYNEELMLASGLFDDAARTREIMYNFMRLRALRVEVDVRLAVGDLDIPGAARYLEQVVPMDADTAQEEAAFFAACPGQALTYQIGKTQIVRLLADSVRAAAGADFDLQRFHDRLWLEGNIPLALQRWELLNDDSDLQRLDQLRRP